MIRAQRRRGPVGSTPAGIQGLGRLAGLDNGLAALAHVADLPAAVELREERAAQADSAWAVVGLTAGKARLGKAGA